MLKMIRYIQLSLIPFHFLPFPSILPLLHIHLPQSNPETAQRSTAQQLNSSRYSYHKFIQSSPPPAHPCRPPLFFSFFPYQVQLEVKDSVSHTPIGHIRHRDNPPFALHIHDPERQYSERQTLAHREPSLYPFIPVKMHNPQTTTKRKETDASPLPIHSMTSLTVMKKTQKK